MRGKGMHLRDQGMRLRDKGMRDKGMHLRDKGMRLRDKGMHPSLVGRQRVAIRMRMWRCLSQAARRQPSFESRAPSLHVRSPAHRRIYPAMRVREYSVQPST